MKPVPFRIHADPLGGNIEIDGTDLTEHVAAFDLHVGQTEPSILSLHLIPGHGPIQGEALIHIADDSDPGDLICAFLDTIDPGELDQHALNNADASSNLTEAMIATLKQWARERT